MNHRQLSFDLPVRSALGRGDFFVSPANAMAVVLLERWQDWAGHKLALIGPKGAGKTHLSHVWAATSGALILKATDLGDVPIPAVAMGPVVVEDVQDIAGDRELEEALFHLHNLVLAEGFPLLVTTDKPAHLWGLTLPDLQSRMQGTQSVTLDQPDDQLLAAVITKLFADRQLMPAPDVITYLVARMDRSFDAARDLVAALDRAALERKRPVTRKLAAEVLGESELPDLLDNSA